MHLSPFTIKSAGVFLACVLAGCQTVQTKKQMVNFDQVYQAGQYSTAATIAKNQGSIDKEGTSKDLLWSLQAGAALSDSADYTMSNAVLDGAESFMKIEDLESLLKKGGEQFTAVMLNNSFNDYDPTVYDGVMVNTIKAVNYFKLKDFQNARIEFNRAAERQRLAEEFFIKKIEEQNKKKQKEGSAANFDQNMSSSMTAVDEEFRELDSWAVYPDFVNPYTDYMHSMFFFLSGAGGSDLGKARESIRRVVGMAPGNKYIKTDLAVIDNVAKGRWKMRNLKPTVWVIFENGLAPKVEEILIPLPLVLVTDKLHYSQIALPKLVERQSAYPYLNVSTSKNKGVKTEELGSIERVIQTEFKKDYPFRVTQAVMSTVVKAAIQYELQKKGGIASMFGALYQAVTTRADTRSWTSLPKEYQVARLSKPSDGKLTITAPGSSQELNIDLPAGQFMIVHVKAATADSGITYDVTAL